MGLITHNFDSAISILARLHGTLPNTFEPQKKEKEKAKLPHDRPRSIGCLVHRNEEFAFLHAKRLEELTGDRCKVRKYRANLFRILRYDASGKRVLNCSY